MNAAPKVPETAAEVDALIEDYLTHGSPKSTVGYRVRAFNCPVARAINRSLPAGMYCGTTGTIAYYREEGRRFGDYPRVVLSKRATIFIFNIDQSGKEGTGVSRGVALRLWQEAKEYVDGSSKQH